jgi:hypothetical protein
LKLFASAVNEDEDEGGVDGVGFSSDEQLAIKPVANVKIPNNFKVDFS